MRYVALLALAIAACKSSQLPTGSLDTQHHPEFAKFRPVAIAVLKVDAPRGYLRDVARKEAYTQLFTIKYSPLALDVVDAHTDSDGTFQPRTLEWDATLHLSVKRWAAASGGGHFIGDGSARLVHKSGEVLWQMSFQDQSFGVPSGDNGREEAVRSMVRLVVSRMPPLPPRPKG